MDVNEYNTLPDGYNYDAINRITGCKNKKESDRTLKDLKEKENREAILCLIRFSW